MVEPTRAQPYVGMEVAVIHLGAVEAAVVEAVADEGRTLRVAGSAYTLRRLTGHYVREGEPYYGTRLSLTPQA